MLFGAFQFDFDPVEAKAVFADDREDLNNLGIEHPRRLPRDNLRDSLEDHIFGQVYLHRGGDQPHAVQTTRPINTPTVMAPTHVNMLRINRSKAFTLPPAH